MAGADSGAVYLLDLNARVGQARTIARSGDDLGQSLDQIASQVFENGQVALSRPKDAPQTAMIGHPVVDDDAIVVATAVLRIPDAGPQRLRNAARALAWGTAWLREGLARDARQRSDQHKQMMFRAHEIFAAMIEDHEARRAAIGTMTRLAQAASADRVSLGFRQRGYVRLAAVSHSAEFRKQMGLNRRVAAAMDEAIDQRAALKYPPPEHEINATRAQKELAGEEGRSAVLTVPFMVGEIYLGAITFQRSEDLPFTPEEVGFLDFTTSLVGPVLWDKKQNDKWLIFKVFDTVGRQFVRLFGPGYALRKLAIACLIGLVFIFSTWSRPYRIASDALVEGAVQRSLVAPFDGFLREATARAGDRVAEGDAIAALDDRDLVLERLRWVTERRQKRLELGRAIGEQDRAETEIFRVQIAQAEAQISLIDARLERAQLIAPFDGIIVAGDQSQNIGGSVSRGTVLFEVAPVDDYRIVMSVDESRISEISIGQSGDLVVTALPNTEFPLVVTKITPVAQAAEGRNTFRVEAGFDVAAPALRPGMHGIAKVDVDERLVVRIWTRELVDWARLTFWLWFG
ncbi:efflux RND transporter periplasmic adaptor subunit [Puniceibacterium sediminis]|nr:HlyD family efflux transporter periplasmic adaptor subunit [Puniceibacterium sediminis]